MCKKKLHKKCNSSPSNRITQLISVARKSEKPIAFCVHFYDTQFRHILLYLNLEFLKKDFLYRFIN